MQSNGYRVRLDRHEVERAFQSYGRVTMDEFGKHFEEVLDRTWIMNSRPAEFDKLRKGAEADLYGIWERGHDGRFPAPYTSFAKVDAIWNSDGKVYLDWNHGEKAEPNAKKAEAPRNNGFPIGVLCSGAIGSGQVASYSFPASICCSGYSSPVPPVAVCEHLPLAKIEPWSYPPVEMGYTRFSVEDEKDVSDDVPMAEPVDDCDCPEDCLQDPDEPERQRLEARRRELENERENLEWEFAQAKAKYDLEAARIRRDFWQVDTAVYDLDRKGGLA
jgi:hypothetical protein